MAAVEETGNHGFEGVEKNLELDFVPSEGTSRGLRGIVREQWDEILAAARCSILSTMSNDHCDSYVLSESSLFVYRDKVVLKTCGTTTLLVCLEPLLKATKALGLVVEWVAYTRKDFTFPTAQKFPHRDPAEEATYLKRFFPTGSAHILGPITGDHWLVFVADYVDRPTTECVDRTLNIMMFDIDQSVARLFTKDTTRFPLDSDVTSAAGIDCLLPGSKIQEFCFEPCGYSMNGLLYDAYWTIHITPESSCSYASFETNIRMSNYDSLIRAVLSIFRPQRYTMTLFADEYGLRSIKSTPFKSVLPVPLVTSQMRAIMGPCAVSHDKYGNSLFEPPVLAAEAAGGAISPVSDTRSEGDATDMKKISASPSLHALPVPGKFPDLGPVALDEFDGLTPLLSIAAPAATSATLTTDFSPSSVADTPTSSSGSRRVISSTVLPPPSRGKGVMTYMLTTKCSTEFLGYLSMLGNFALVHASSGAVSGQDAADIADAGGGLLSMPRAKFALAQKARQEHGRLRTESV